MFGLVSPRNRRRAAAQAPPASGPPPPGWRWSSWWWSSTPSRSARSDTPAGCRRWSPRSAAPRTPGPAGCVPPGPPLPRSGWPTCPPRLLRSVPVRAAAARPVDSHECRDGLWAPHRGDMMVPRRLRMVRGAPMRSGTSFTHRNNFA